MPAGPAHPERVDPAQDDIRPIERLLGLLELEGSGRLGDLEVEARMHARLLDALDDLTVEVRADQAYLVAVVRERKGEGRGHYARAKNANGRHAFPERRSEKSQQTAFRQPLPARLRHGPRSPLARTVRRRTPRGCRSRKPSRGRYGACGSFAPASTLSRSHPNLARPRRGQ